MGEATETGSGGGGKPAKASWEAVVSAVVAVGTLTFGVVSWVDGRLHPKPVEKSEEKVVVVAPAAPVPVPLPATTPATAPAPSPEVAADATHSPHVLALANGNSFHYYRNFGLDTVHPLVQRAVVVLPNCLNGHHGNLFRGVLQQARLAGREADTLVVVPIFQMSKEHLRPSEPLWTSAWEIGAQSVGDDSISSGQVVDELLGQVARKGHFPDLKEIVLVGYGAAATFVNRYVAGGEPLEGVELTHLVVNATSYLYLDNLRPIEGSEGFAVPDPAACPDFNHYRYGLEKRNPYMRRLSADTLRRNMRRRRAIYVVSTAEAKEKVEPTAAERVQGITRFERASNYWRYIQRTPEWAANAEFRPFEGPGHLSLTSADCKPLIDLMFGPVWAKKAEDAAGKVAHRP